MFISMPARSSGTSNSVLSMMSRSSSVTCRPTMMSATLACSSVSISSGACEVRFADLNPSFRMQLERPEVDLFTPPFSSMTPRRLR